MVCTHVGHCKARLFRTRRPLTPIISICLWHVEPNRLQTDSMLVKASHLHSSEARTTLSFLLLLEF
eukprot:5507456-Amphidinium_carterae.1